jgi:hypothetical protein
MIVRLIGSSANLSAGNPVSGFNLPVSPAVKLTPPEATCKNAAAEQPFGMVPEGSPLAGGSISRPAPIQLHLACGERTYQAAYPYNRRLISSPLRYIFKTRNAARGCLMHVKCR